MILDKNLTLVDKTAANLIAHTSGTQVLEGDVIDFGEKRHLGEGLPLYVSVRIDTTIAASSGAVLSLVLQGADNAAMSSNRGTVTVVIPDTGKGALTKGKFWEIAIESFSDDGGYKRYFQLAWQGTQAHLASVSAGAISAWIGFQHGIYRPVKDYRG